MTAFTKTITNSLVMLGGSPTNLWNTMLWGQKWGEGTIVLVFKVFKVISNSQIFDTSISKNQTHLILESLAIVSNMSDETLRDLAGYEYVFAGPSTNAQDRPNTAWTDEGPGDVITWTCQIAGSTIWS